MSDGVPSRDCAGGKVGSNLVGSDIKNVGQEVAETGGNGAWVHESTPSNNLIQYGISGKLFVRSSSYRTVSPAASTGRKPWDGKKSAQSRFFELGMYSPTRRTAPRDRALAAMWARSAVSTPRPMTRQES